MASVIMLAIINIWPVSAALFSGLFAVFIVMGLISFRRGKSHRRFWERMPLFLGYAAWIFIVLLLAVYGHMPVTTWIW